MSNKKTKREKKMEWQEWKERLAPYIYDYDSLEARCTASIESFNLMVKKLPNGTVTRHGNESLAFIDNGADILGVAHLDATGAYPHFAHFQVGGPQGDEWVFSRWLDDRLGVFLLLDVLPRFAHFDMLLTTGEETGQTSAKFFQPPAGKKYRWMFEPDRMGDDVVHYQYNTKQLLEALRQAGFSGLSHGSFTDICKLEHLGVCGFNFGIGYHDNHIDWSRANLSQTLAQTARFMRFYEANQEVDFPFDPKVVKAVAPVGAWPRGDSDYGWEGYNYSSRWDDALFDYEQVVKYLPSGELWQVVGAPHKWGTDKEPMYWCRRPLNPDKPKNEYGYASMTSRDLAEGDMSADLTAEEIKIARELFQRPRFKPLTTAPTEQDQLIAEFEALVEVTDKTKVKWLVLAKLCDGPRPDPLTVRARRLYEIKYFNAPLSVKSHSNELPKPWPVNEPVYVCGQVVYTPYGKGRIDALYPVVVNGDEPHWWIRYEAPDRDELTCHLEASSTLSSVLPLSLINLNGGKA